MYKYMYIYIYITLCFPCYCSLLHGRSLDKSSSQEHTIHFINVFLLVWGGAAVVTVNAQLLRGKVYVYSTFITQCACIKDKVIGHVHL